MTTRGLRRTQHDLGQHGDFPGKDSQASLLARCGCLAPVTWCTPAEAGALARQLGAMHKRSYAKTGVALEDITVTHWLLDPVS